MSERQPAFQFGIGVKASTEEEAENDAESKLKEFYDEEVYIFNTNVHDDGPYTVIVDVIMPDRDPDDAPEDTPYDCDYVDIIAVKDTEEYTF